MRSWVQRVLKSVSLTHASVAGYSLEFDVGRFDTLLMTLNATIGLTGGAAPGVKFTLEVDPGDGTWIAASTLIATGNGFAANAVADSTITSTSKAYRYYPVLAGYRGRVKYEITGTPTGGTAAVNAIDLHLRGV